MELFGTVHLTLLGIIIAIAILLSARLALVPSCRSPRIPLPDGRGSEVVAEPRA